MAATRANRLTDPILPLGGATRSVFWLRLAETRNAAMNGKNFPPTADRIRIDIDRGLEGDKIPYPDPAVAPLGTDEEVAGAPPTQEERAMAAKNRPAVAEVKDSENDRLPGGGAAISGRAAFLGALLLLIVGAMLVLLRLNQLG